MFLCTEDVTVRTPLLGSYPPSVWKASACTVQQHRLAAHATFQTKRLIHQSVQSAAPVWSQRDRGCARMSVCMPGFPRVHQQLCRADGPLRYGGAILWGPLWSHRHCDQLCLPPAIGQGSYNRRSGGRGPPRTAQQLSRCGEGVGRGGLRSPTAEKRPNEVPGDGPMNHYQLCYI